MNNRGYAFAKAVVATPASRQRFFRSHTRRRRRNYLIVPLLGVLVLVGVAHAQESINLRRTVTVDVVARTKNAVVYISTTKLVAQRMSPFPQDMFLRDLDLGFGRIVKVPQNALGSGFVVHPSGYVVTNNHVIERARQIKVELADGRKLDAELISSDPEADLAILKVNSQTPLPALELGDSSDLMIGEPVIAVGNPLGFSHSVSTGIVSAIHRDLSTANPQMKGMTDLVQTDAAINPGNSGGPLLNAYGQVIGINTAIRGDAQNIGFAIQSSTLRDMIPALLNPAQAAKLDIPATLAERRTVKPPSTIEAKVELCESEKRYVITEINGHQPKDIVDAYAMVLACKPGDEITFKLEGGETRKIKVKPAAVPEVVKTVRTKLGITVEELTPMLAEKHGLPVDEGILVTEVQEGSRAQTAGLQAGDVIVQIGVPVQRYLLINPVTKLDKLGIIVQRLPASGVIQLGVHRGNESGTINLNLGSPKRDSI